MVVLGDGLTGNPSATTGVDSFRLTITQRSFGEDSSPFLLDILMCVPCANGTLEMNERVHAQSVNPEHDLRNDAKASTACVDTNVNIQPLGRPVCH